MSVNVRNSISPSNFSFTGVSAALLYVSNVQACIELI